MPRLLVCAHTTVPPPTQIASQAEVDNAVELIETLAPLGVKPGVCRYLGPYVDLRE